MAWTCDICDGAFTPDNPMYEHRTTRPSDPSDMCCVMVSHNACLPGGKTGAEWDEWIETEGAALGYIWLS